jgi:hypothetical protein
MKTLKLITLGIVMFFASSSMHSQVSISVNLGLQPSWGPVGYSSVNYYYLPDVQAYYDVRSTQFIYLSGGTWIRSSHLPRQYRNYDLDRGYKVVLNDYHGSRPYTNYRYDRVKYYKGYSRPQESIGHRGENRGNDRNYENNGNNGHYNGGGNEGRGNEGRGNKGGGDKGHGNEGGGHGHGKK